jgi:hypothetical protein
LPWLVHESGHRASKSDGMVTPPTPLLLK